MKILYGVALPPGLSAPTRGEIRLRIDRLVLHRELVDAVPHSTAATAAPPLASVPIDDCVLEPLWWGESRPSVRATPTTNTHERGAVTVVHAVKTLRPQLERYLNDMDAAGSGLRIAVVVPSSVSGRRDDVPVGSALLRVDGLAPGVPIAGWFSVMDPSERHCVGRMKLVLTATYFDAAQPVAKTKEGTAAFAALVGKGQEQQPQAAPHPRNTDDAGHGSLRHDAHAASVATNPGATAATAGGPPPKPPLAPTGPKPAVSAASVTTDTDATTTESAGAAFTTGVLGASAQATDRVREILLRGLELRDRMAEAAQRTNIDDAPSLWRSSPAGSVGAPSATAASIAALAAPGGYYLGTVGGRHSGSEPATAPALPPPFFPMPSGSENLFVDPWRMRAEAARVGGAVANGGDWGDTNGYGSNSDESSRGEWSDDDVYDPSRRSGAYGGGDDSEAGGHGAAFSAPTTHFLGSHRLGIAIGQVSFSCVVHEVRFVARTSRDVTFPMPVKELSSAIYLVPLGGDVQLEAFVASFTDDSRLVLECYDVRSRFDPARGVNIFLSERLLGVCVVGLHTQQQQVAFHDPLSGEDPVRATVRVDIAALSTAQATSSINAMQQSQLDRFQQLHDDHHRQQHHQSPREHEQRTADGHKPKRQRSPADIPAKEAKHGAGENRKSKGRGGKEKKSKSRSKHRTGDDKNDAHERSHHKRTSGSQPSTHAAATRTMPSVLDADRNQTPTTAADHKPRAALRLAVRVCGAKNVARVVEGAPGPHAAPSSPPRLFVCLEDVLGTGTGTSGASSGASPPLFIGLSSAAAADQVNICEWTADTERSAVAVPGCDPSFDFVATLTLPQPTDIEHASTGREGIPLQKMARRLRWLTLSLWHHFGTDDLNGEDADDAELALWSQSRMMGRCEVDLRPLWFAPVESAGPHPVDGWFHVHGASDEVGSLRTSIGQLKVQVRILNNEG